MFSLGMKDVERVIERGNILQNILNEDISMKGIEFLTRSVTPVPLDSVVIVRTAPSVSGFGCMYHTFDKIDTAKALWTDEKEFNDRLDGKWIEWALLEGMNDE